MKLLLLFATMLCSSYGQTSFTAGPATRLRAATGAPPGDDCQAGSDVGKIYMRKDASAAKSTLYSCANTAPSTYGWELLGGGSGITTMLTGSVDPTVGPVSCAAPSFSSLTLYTQTVTKEIWTCIDTDTWRKPVVTNGAGPYIETTTTGTIPDRPILAGDITCYSDSADKMKICLDNGSGIALMVKGAASRTANQFLGYINIHGDQVPYAIAPGDIPVGSSTAAGGITRIFSGTATLGTSSIPSASCATVVTVTAVGVLSTDTISWTPNASIKAVTGYVPSTSGGLSLAMYPGTDAVYVDQCNWTASAVVPGAVVLNWKVIR